MCHNYEGQIIHMSSRINSPCSSNMGEALGAQLAISLVGSLLLNKFILEGNFAVVIQALNHPHSDIDWRISPIIMESLDSIPSTFSWEARKINRSANFCAYSVARWTTARSHSCSIPFSSSYIPPSSLPSGTDPPLSLSPL